MEAQRKIRSDSLCIWFYLYRLHISKKGYEVWRSGFRYTESLILSFFVPPFTFNLCFWPWWKEGQNLFPPKLKRHLSSSLTWPTWDPWLSFIFLFNLSRQSDFVYLSCIHISLWPVRFHKLLMKFTLRNIWGVDVKWSSCADVAH